MSDEGTDSGSSTATAEAPATATSPASVPTEAPVQADPQDEFLEPDENGLPPGSDTEDTDPVGDPPQNVGETKAPPMGPALLARAEALGLTREEALEYGDPKTLERAISHMERVSPKQQQQAAPVPQDADIPDLDPEVYDEKIVAGWGAMKQTIGSLQAQLGQLLDINRQTATKEFGDWFYGKAVKGLGDQYKPLVSNGGERKILDAMDTLHRGYMQRGQQLPSRDDLFKQAVSIAFGDQAQSVARKEIGQQLDKRKGNLLNRNTQRPGKSLTPEQAAIRAVSEKMAAFGDTPEEA